VRPGRAGPGSGSGVPLANTFRLLGAALAVAATDPPHWADEPALITVRLIAVALAVVWAAAPMAARPVTTSRQFTVILSRHRNTLFVIAAVVVAALGNPPTWLTVVDCALVLTYLVLLDAATAGPVGGRQLRRAGTLLSAAAASAAVLLCAQVPVGSDSGWGRIIAALAVAAAACAVGTVLWLRRTVE
jgi:hypothetical protein